MLENNNRRTQSLQKIMNVCVLPITDVCGPHVRWQLVAEGAVPPPPQSAENTLKHTKNTDKNTASGGVCSKVMISCHRFSLKHRRLLLLRHAVVLFNARQTRKQVISWEVTVTP